MKYLDILVPVKNEEDNVAELVARVDKALNLAQIDYSLIFVDDNSEDKTVKVLSKLQKDYPIKVIKKKGRPGKAYSILEAANFASGENLAMIDGDLQYPPEKIPEMFEKLQKDGVVVARRKEQETKGFRKFSSKVFNFAFGKMLFNFDVDVQSGLKLFKKEIISQISEKDVSAWTLDIPLLITARDMGHTISEVTIDFQQRRKGESKISFTKAALEMAAHTIIHKLRRNKVYRLTPGYKSTMVGAGVAHRGKRFITHTTLEPKFSAIHTLGIWQKLFISLILTLVVLGLFLNSLLTIQVVIAVLSFIYFADVLFNFFLIFKSLHHPPEIVISEQDLSSIDENELPIYSIVSPLYKEARVLPGFLEAISKIDWPKHRLDVMLLLEEDDKETIEAAKNINLPGYVRIVVVPDSNPKTKPKACNYGLSFAKGEYLVIYDAEDVPDPLQLKKAYLAFKRSGDKVVCLQAKLNYHNPHQNFLTRLFTAEYSLWFDVILTGLQSIETSIPLGGTSNHFRTKDLLKLQGWDPFNVTEDCDLGIRLFQSGYKTAIFDSTTLEEANSSLGNWVRQRSRWIKGYMQTYLVQMRHPLELIRKQGLVHMLIFQLVVGGKIAFMFINPFLWVTTIAYFSLRAIVGPSIEAVYPPYVFYMAAFSLVFGNFLFLYYYMIGCAKREHWSLIKYVYFVPFYWLAVSWAACIALYQLIFKPHYWEKTVHGLHLKKEEIVQIAQNIPSPAMGELQPLMSQPPKKPRFSLDKLIPNRALFMSASMLVFASMVSNVLNFVFNAYLGRNLTLEDFGNLTLFSSLLYLSSIPLWALSATATHKIGYLFGKYSKEQAKGYLGYVALRSFILAGFLSVLWVLAVPFLSNFFNTQSVLPMLIFTPVWLIGVVQASFGGYLRGTLSFGILAFVALTESITKLILAYLIVQTGAKELAYLAIPASLLGAMIMEIIFTIRGRSVAVPKEEANFNKAFYASALLSGVTNVNFLTLDIILVKHFLSPIEAGQYGLLALVGKMTFFFGSLLGPFMLPIVSRNEGSKRGSRHTFLFLFGSTALFSLCAFIGLGVFGDLIVPFLFGDKTLSILHLLPIYVLAIVMFTITQPVITFFQAKQNYLYAFVAFLVSLSQILLISIFHQNLEQVVWVMFSVGVINLSLMGLLFSFNKYLWLIQRAAGDLFDLLFRPTFKNGVETASGLSLNKRILIFNWRDIKHKWAGGAEIYLHELAKKWVEEGHKVTIFCGNDSHNLRYEVIDGIQIIRRGGFYMVYIWAFLYYTLRLRGKFDLVIDSENGIPFFTPLYVRIPKFLLIHHIHQEVFREHLFYPLAILASFLEAKMMPYFYKDQKVITVSGSSKEEIVKLSGENFQSIDIVNPGIHHDNFVTLPKTKQPSFLYLGRLQPYKNIDIAIRAFAQVLKEYPKASFKIAGSGLSMATLKGLVKKLEIESSVEFLGRVNEKDKRKLLAASWAMIQPSMIEGWGITVVEANASGTPVIASNVNGLKDSIIDGKTGLLVKAKSISDFTIAMEKIIREKSLREKLSREALVWSKNFSWEKSAQDFFKSIRSATDEWPKSPSYRGALFSERSSV